MRRVLLLASAVLLAAARAGAAVGPWQAHPQVQVRLVSPWDAAARPTAGSRELLLGVEVVLQPHWHSYWRNSGDAGFAPALVVKTPEIESAEMLFPAPRRFELRGGLVAFGYEDAVV